MCLVLLYSFNFCFLGKILYFSFYFKFYLAGSTILGYKFFPFRTLDISCQSFLACSVSVEKSANSLIGGGGGPLIINLFFSLDSFRILSFALIFSIFIIIFLGVGLFGSNLFKALCDSYILYKILVS